ncbi:MAG TPA: hypothetical protein DCZ72_06485, partial [Armatimonadetes bacterium]|nr:hypothetical protein [Armatimonadota bacterium]
MLTWNRPRAVTGKATDSASGPASRARSRRGLAARATGLRGLPLATLPLPRPGPILGSMSDFLQALSERVLIADGAVGTVLQDHQLAEVDFDGYDGCNEILNLTRPDIVRAIHERYLDVGCDAVETNAFGAGAVVLGEYELADRVHEINLAAVRLAREAVERYSTSVWPRFVIGNMGPGTRLPSLGHIDFEILAGYYAAQAIGLIEGGVDALIIETVQDIL